MAKGDALLSLVRPRVVLPASGVVWVTAAALHAAHVAPFDVALVSVTTAAVVFATRARPLTGTAASAGAWLTAATAAGPLAGPWHALTLTWAGGTLTGLAVLHRHEAVRAAKRWRWARRRWLSSAGEIGLDGSHLVGHEDTRLGEAMELDVTGTGKLASTIASGALAEVIAQREKLPVSRVQVTPGRLAGRVRVSIRYKDPWAHPIPHPLLAKDPEVDLPVPATIRKPLPVGQDPETGDPLTVTLWDEDGAKNFLIVAKKRGGKTVLLSDLRERITAAEDAVLWNINLSKSVEDREWSPACQHSACGRQAAGNALAMLRGARKLIDTRGATPRDTPVFQPTPADRLVVLLIDELDTLTRYPAAKELLDYIGSKNGSEGVAVVAAGQRGTADWVPTGFRANVDYVAMGKVNRRGEMMHAAGDMGLTLPDMATYGEGHPGVWVIAEVGGGYEVGRTFNLNELTDIRKIAAERAVKAPAMAGGPPTEPTTAGSTTGPEDGSSSFTPEDNPLRIIGQAVLSGEIQADDETKATFAAAEDVEKRREQEWLDSMDADLGDIPDELQQKLHALDEKNARNREIVQENQEIIDRLPKVDPGYLAESTAERWKQAAEQTTIPDGARRKLLGLLSGEGMSGRKLLEHFPDVKRARMMLWLNRLRFEGVAYVNGKGAAARWCLTPKGVTECDDGDDG